MNPFINKKELEERCKNPQFCIACLRVRDESIPVDEHHVCLECRRGSRGMPRRLPAITLPNGKTYFIDERLRQFRNVHNPHDSIDF
jgi:hypothetical protein